MYVRIHCWVLWWLYVGMACGAVALTNIFFRDLTPTQVRVLLAVGVLHWFLGGLVCYASEGVRFEKPPQAPQNQPRETVPVEKEWHDASEFVLAGSHHHELLPPGLDSRTVHIPYRRAAAKRYK